MKLLRIFMLWLLALLLLAVLSWGMALFLEWPVWAAVATFLGCLGLYVLLRFVVRQIQVFRSRSRMAQLSAASQTKAAAAASPRAVLSRNWKTAVGALRASNLRRLGNPLHVLPWYMVVGRSGTGKTTALTRTRLPSSIRKVNQSAPIEQTANYDWWYFDRAVIIDCAGRYVEAADLEQDRSEWEFGLDQLAKYRGSQGLNGLVLAISAERLISPDKDGLMEEGRVIRERIEQLIRLFGKRFPVYVLVTQCDRIYGLEEWASQLSEGALEQAMGFLAEPETDEPAERQFIDRAFDSIHGRLQMLRTSLMAHGGPVAPELLMFPNELYQLKPSLGVFLRACFGDSAYLETPFFRGLFFSSGLQQGGGVSTLLGKVLPAVPPHAGANAGIFLHDFFGQILPQDRDISLAATLRNPWRAATQHLGLLALVLLSIAAAIFMSVGFASNMKTLSLLEDKTRFNSKFVGRLEDDAETLERMSATISLIENRNNEWENRWMVSSTRIDELETKLKSNYTDNFRKYILPVTDANYTQDVSRFVPGDPNSEFPLMMQNLVRYINLLQEHQRGADRADLLALPQRQPTSRYSPGFYASLNQLYISNISWSTPGDPYVPLRLRAEQTLLNRFAFNDPVMTWLPGIVKANTELKAVTVQDFWGSADSAIGRVPGQELPVVAAAFTIAGKKEIDSFLAEMEKSVDDGPRFLAQRAAFEAWYRDQRLRTWQKFVSDFSGTERSLIGEAEWRAAMGGVVGASSPYYRLLNRLNEEFSAEASADLPSWLQLARQLGELRLQANRETTPKSTLGVVGTINTVGGKAIKEVLSGAAKQGEATLTGNIAAVETLQAFSANIKAVATEVVAGPGKAYQAAVDFHSFSTDPAGKTSALHAAADQLVQFRRLVGYNNPDDELIWQLMGGPLRFVLTYTAEQASCSLQSEWAAKVDWPLQTVPNMTAMVEQLYGDKGSVWAFADGPAKPFLQRDADRFSIVETLGYSVPFTRQFLPMLNDAAGKRVEQLVTRQRSDLQEQTEKLAAEKEQLQSQQALAQADRVLADVKQKSDAIKALVPQLSITTQPTSVNSGAKAKPFAAVLSIQCASGARVINNFNFPVSDSFPLGERHCGDVTLQIKIEELVLTKKYPGSTGVVRFLQDFRDGSRQFNVDEFPQARTRLDALGVRQISVHYIFEGQDVILKAAQQLDLLNRQERDSTAEKRRLQDVQFARDERVIQTRLSGAGSEPSIKVSLPKQIGVCWDAGATAHRPQNINTLFKELASARVQMSLPGVLPSGSAGKSSVHQTRKLSLSVTP